MFWIIKRFHINKSVFVSFKSSILVFTLLFIFNSFAFSEITIPKNPRDWTLKILLSDSTKIFTQNEIPFTFYIPGDRIDNYQADLPELPLGVKFLSSEKKYNSINSDGTEIYEITYWFSFSDAGVISIPPLTVSFGSNIYYLPFETVEVYENPAILSPSLSVLFIKDGNTINFDDNFNFNEKVTMEVYVQFCVQILNLTYKLPDNSIFKEISREDIVKSNIRNSDFTTKKYKLATFDWTPLIDGNVPIPEIIIDAIAYNGDRKRISTLDANQNVNVLKPNKLKKDSINNSINFDDLFETAFTENKIEIESKNNISKWTPADVKMLVDLRKQERHSLPYTSVTDMRKKFEAQFGLENTDDESSVTLLIIFSIVAALGISIHLLMILNKHAKTSVLFAIIFVIFAVLSIRQYINTHQQYAISVSGKIYSVPEEITDPKATVRIIPEGLRVKVVERINDWLYVECSETCGWIKSDSVIFIK